MTFFLKRKFKHFLITKRFILLSGRWVDYLMLKQKCALTAKVQLTLTLKELLFFLFLKRMTKPGMMSHHAGLYWIYFQKEMDVISV